ncbi:MAG TPA: TIGR02597 family protein, partial [Verrucomicrobiae bacterium]|nr:TIGR02597 family protein [Verrucomicrobiae bacterium]
MRVLSAFEFARGAFRLAAFSFFVSLGLNAEASLANPAALPEIGEYSLTILTPTLLELSLVTTKDADPAPATTWNFIGSNFTPALPPATEFQVAVDGSPVGVTDVGFKRRPAYAPLQVRDLRIGNYLYLKLATPVGDGQTVTVHNPSGALWRDDQTHYSSVASATRFNPAIHVNEVGYLPNGSKRAMIGYYAGSFGEIDLPSAAFNLVDAAGTVVFSGGLTARPDIGYDYSPLPYQKVFQADFSGFSPPGEYRLQVPGMGVSFPFLINEGTAAVFARTLALGLYHQRCGGKNEMPYTRHEHGDCHTGLVEIPTMASTAVNQFLAEYSSDYTNDPLHTAPQLKDVDSSLYPFVNKNPIDLRGGHHDAGDYSKYTINSAGLIHHLVFAVDAFPGVGDLDNLGIPESGDGKSDLLQEAKWEADFLAKMQDADGGFYFLVYPRDRAYEDDVLPDHGDPQVVFPKTSAATAAAVGALANIASSPRFKAQFPTEAAAYLTKALNGWNFLTNAIAKFGKNGAYQKITHYGDDFMHDDELAWAAAALFAATGQSEFHDKLREWYDPSDPNTRRWTWWRLFEGYGCAARTYAFAARSGRLSPSALDPDYLAKCETEIVAAGDDIVRFAEQTAYGTSFPDPNKSFRTAGWYFSSERSFEAATAQQIAPNPKYLETIISNMNYEGGCNPINIPYLTGVGWERWREIVDQYAQNDYQVLPPSGIPLGNIQGGFAYLDNYKQELGALCFPPDGANSAPYPFYDRWGDSFNTTTEFVVVDEARSLASIASLFALTGKASSSYVRVPVQIVGLPGTIPAATQISANALVPGADMTGARVLWEARDQQPFIGNTFNFIPKNPGAQWVEVDILFSDGTRLFAKTNFLATYADNIPPNPDESQPLSPTTDLAALYHLDDALTDAMGKSPALTLTGNAQLDALNIGWMSSRSGKALHVFDLGDEATVTIPADQLYADGTTVEITLEAMVYVNAYKGWNRASARLLSLDQAWNASLQWTEDIYTGPHLGGGSQFDFSGAALAAAMPIQQWHHLAVSINATGYSARVDGNLIASAPSSEFSAWSAGTAVLEIGNFDGWIDEIAVRSRSAQSGPIDSDGDGLPDNYEIAHGLNPADASDAASDWDGDGLTALQEFWLGSDPSNSRSGLRITGVDATGGTVQVQFAPVSGNSYIVEQNVPFPSGGWTDATIVLSGGVAALALQDVTTSGGTAYRVKASTPVGTNVVSELAGVQHLTFLGDSDTMFSVPFLRPAAELGAVVSVSANSIRLRGAPEWQPNQWTYVAGIQTNTYFLLFRSGSHEGESYTITANTADTLTLDLQGVALDGVAAGDRVAIVPYWTLGTVFPGGTGVNSSPTPGNRLTEIFLPDISGVGVNLSA